MANAIAYVKNASPGAFFAKTLAYFKKKFVSLQA